MTAATKEDSEPEAKPAAFLLRFNMTDWACLCVFCKSMGIYHAGIDAERYQHTPLLLLCLCADPKALLDATDRPSSNAKFPRLKPGL